jgi:hypothetical protein
MSVSCRNREARRDRSLIGVFGLGMANVAGYNVLQDAIGKVWAAAAVALADFAIAAMVLILAMRSVKDLKSNSC